MRHINVVVDASNDQLNSVNADISHEGRAFLRACNYHELKDLSQHRGYTPAVWQSTILKQKQHR